MSKGQVVQFKDLIDLSMPLGRLSAEYRDWLRFIEPKVVRGIYLPCWCWRGRMQVAHKHTIRESLAYPTLYVPVDPNDERKGKKLAYTRRVIASMFWHYPESFIVYNTCQMMDCVNPNHFAISYRNDKEYM